MATGQVSEVLQHLRRAVLLRDGAGLTDGQLLEEFLGRRDEAALAALVRRHGPMVWGVCRRVLRDHHDAEDAFQATFLVLVRKAASIVPPAMVANWLYGVAYQTALKARAKAAKRRARERQVEVPEPEAAQPDLWRDLQPLLDRELSRLPDKYRVPIVLCDLEGKTRKEAARQLGWPEGTVAGRQARGRALLAKRLAPCGLALSGGSLALVLSQAGASAGVPATLVSSTVQAATTFAAGQAAAGVISPDVAALTTGVVKPMFQTKFNGLAAVLLTVGVLGAGAGWLTHRALADKPAKPASKDAGEKGRTEVRGVVKAVDAGENTLRVRLGKESPGEEAFSVARDAEILLDDGTGDKVGFRQGELADLTEDTLVTLRLSPDRKVTRVWAEGPTLQGTLKAVDADNRRITAAIPQKKGEPPADQTFPVAPNAKVFIDDGKVHDKSLPAKPPGLSELPLDAVVWLKLSADRKAVGGIRAEGRQVTGLVNTVDGARNTLTITLSSKGQPDVERTFPVAKAAHVSIEDGKPEGKVKPAEARGLAEVPVGARVTLRLSPDGRSVVALRAEGSDVHGTVKAVDADRNTLTLHDKVAGEKTYPVGPGAAVYLDGKAEAKKLADVPAGAVVDLDLLVDQKTVREVRANGPTVLGRVVGAAGAGSVTLRDKEGDKSFAVAGDARILIDGAQEGKLTDLIDGTVARLRLSTDKATALEVHAEGPSFRGKVKAFAPDKDTLTVTVGAKADVEDREFRLTKDTVIQTEIYGARLKRTDLREDKEVVVRLSIDQKAAARVTVLGE